MSDLNGHAAPSSLLDSMQEKARRQNLAALCERDDGPTYVAVLRALLERAELRHKNPRMLSAEELAVLEYGRAILAR